jgi:hypothetical protein
MNKKLKRIPYKKFKREVVPPMLDFVTPLTQPECLARLKGMAFGTSFVIRTDEQEFILEIPNGEAPDTVSTIRLQGQFDSQAEGTRVCGHIDVIKDEGWLGIDSLPLSLIFSGAVLCIFAIALPLVKVDLPINTLLLFLMMFALGTGIFIAGYLESIETDKRTEKTKGEICEWVQQILCSPDVVPK